MRSFCAARASITAAELIRFRRIPLVTSIRSGRKPAESPPLARPLEGGGTQLPEQKPVQFDTAGFLASTGLGRKIVQFKPKQTFFSQGDPADCIFYLQKGRAKLTVVSKNGKEATITLLGSGDFVGEESLTGAAGPRMATPLPLPPVH